MNLPHVKSRVRLFKILPLQMALTVKVRKKAASTHTS